MTEGFTPQENQYELKFDVGHPLHGLEVTMASLTVGEYNAMMKRSLIKGMTQETIDANEEFQALFLRKLLKWNLTDKNKKAVPRTKAGIESQDRKYIGHIYAAWQMAMLGIDELLGKDSTNGGQSLEESLGLGNSSQSPSS